MVGRSLDGADKLYSAPPYDGLVSESRSNGCWIHTPPRDLCPLPDSLASPCLGPSISAIGWFCFPPEQESQPRVSRLPSLRTGSKPAANSAHPVRAPQARRQQSRAATFSRAQFSVPSQFLRFSVPSLSFTDGRASLQPAVWRLRVMSPLFFSSKFKLVVGCIRVSALCRRLVESPDPTLT